MAVDHIDYILLIVIYTSSLTVLIQKNKHMKNLHLFDIAGGSVMGTRHTKLGRNNQDHLLWIRNDKYIIALVSDGCSSGQYSEVGSKILSSLFAHTLAGYLRRNTTLSDENLLRHDWLWYNVRQDVLARIRIIAQEMDENLIETIRMYFLSTLLGVVITPHITCVFSCGDGVYFINGEHHVIGPFAGNKPPYLVYGITGSEVTNNDPSLLNIQRHGLYSTDDLQHLLIGTDGVSDLIDIATKHYPGQEKIIGDISQFWTNDLYFWNPEWIRNVLTMINTEKRKPIWEEKNIIKHQGLLPDDTTLITIRTRKEELS